MKYIFDLKSIPDEKIRLAGGKASSLSKMLSDLKVRVPGGSVITADAFDGGVMKIEAEAELDALIGNISRKVTYAVRSSAIGEDGADKSFAGQYETITDVRADGIKEAVRKVCSSASNERVNEYKNSFGGTGAGIGVVIQEFVKPEFAGVVFTSDVLNGKDEYLTGNYVKGEGELLVSGQSNAEVFRINSIKYAYDGNAEFERYAKTLGRYCQSIRRYYGVPMDIEWAVSSGKVYILQARPITTLRRHIEEDYDYNGTRSGYKLLTRTNVGEIFMKPVSPMTMSVLDKINDMLGLPEWLDNVCGQAYMNVSVMCSLIVSFGKTRQQAFEAVKDLCGDIPEGVDIPVSPFDRGDFFRKVKSLLFPKEKSKLSKAEKKKMVEDLAVISREFMGKIRGINSNAELMRFWDEVLIRNLNDGLASIMSECGTSLVPLFGTRKKIAKIAGEDMANRLCGGCTGVLDSMKPLLLIEDVIDGTLSKDEYVNICGHRCANEMELMEPRPYEDTSFPDSIINERRTSGVSLRYMQAEQSEQFAEALKEFKQKYPSKAHWIDKEIGKFVHANSFREEIRSKGVWIFCVFREFILKAGSLNGLGNDIFMLHYDELFALLKGDSSAVEFIPERKQTFRKYCEYPTFPCIIMGRFDPGKWLSDPHRRNDFYCEELTQDAVCDSDVKGFPGAAGVVTGTVRVISDISHIDEIEQGDILVTCATNIGWTLVFPKVSAIVTDIGAPLSHAAIVAREFGIPAVVGCGNATTVLHTGDKVTVDGSHGTVTLI